MITHDAQSSRSLATEILLALDELQVRTNRCHWIVSLIPPGTKTPAAIVLSQGQVVIRSADSPFAKGEVLLGGINDGALTFSGRHRCFQSQHEPRSTCRGVATLLGTSLLWRETTRGYDLADSRALANGARAPNLGRYCR